MRCLTKRKKKIKYNAQFIHFLFFVLLIFAIVNIYSYKKNGELLFFINQKVRKEERIKQKQEEYNFCLEKKYTENEITEELALKKQELDDLIIENKYRVSVYYEDITTGFLYTYQPYVSYYGASLIKLVDALYLINKAIDGKIDLDKETMVYKEEYKRAFSSGMSTHKFGEEISLRDLITYAVSVSDNSAHYMLYDYIGHSNLKAYGQSLGGKLILTGGDIFGNQSAEDTNCYLKEAYRIIKENEEYGPYLKSIMDNNVRNSYNTNEIKIYHKYGAYDIYYHDIGLSLEEYPYTISIFTLHEDKNYKEVIQNIHMKIRELRDLFLEYRKNICYQEVYSN